MPRSRVVNLFCRRVTRHVVTTKAVLVVFKIVFRRFQTRAVDITNFRRIRAGRADDGQKMSLYTPMYTM